MNNLVSVVIPVYNVEKYIEKCLDSVITQTYQMIEIIVVDDGSPDKSFEIYNRYAANDPRIKIIKKENGGLMSAWIAGLKESNGKYICFVDSDDWIDSNMIETLYQSINVEQYDIVCSGYVHEFVNDKVYHRKQDELVFEGKDIKNSLIKDMCLSYTHEIPNFSVCRWDKIYKKDLLINALNYLDDKITIGEDFNTNLACLSKSKKVKILKEFMPYHYRNLNTSMINSYNKNTVNNIQRLLNSSIIICEDENINIKYIYSFIGNMIFEEINKIIKSHMNFKEKINLINMFIKNDLLYNCLKQYKKDRNQKFVSLYIDILRKSIIFGYSYRRIYNIMTGK